jgi:hypothetical protein
MKKISILILSIFSIGFGALAQNQIANLEGINYQAVAIDEVGHEIVGTDINGKPLYEREIGIRFTISNGPLGTTNYYQDEHVTTTDKYGLFSLTIGLGNQTGNGSYSTLLDIPWINGDQWLMVEIATKNDGNYKQVSYEKFMAVPYAFYTDDISDNSITTFKIVDSTILNIDISTGAIDSRTILNESILAEDIATGAVTTDEILDFTILNEDVSTGAIDTRTILNETILAEDIATGAVTTDEILNETILAEDIATGAVTTNEILNETILNEDIANGTIDLTSKVTGILPVENGGTGLDGSAATDGQLLIGDGTSGGFNLANLTAGTGIIITNSPGGIVVSSGVQGISTISTDPTTVGNIAGGGTVLVGPITLAGVNPGDFVVASYENPLQGCLMTGYVRNANQIEVAIFNPNTTNKNLGTGIFKVLILQ